MKALIKKESLGNRLGERLTIKGLVSKKTVEKALAIQDGEPESIRRKLGDILVHDCKVDRHVVYGEVAEMYAFSQVDLGSDAVYQGNISTIKLLFDKLKPEVQEAIRENAVLPYRSENGQRNVLYIAAADPTYSEIPNIATALGFSQYEVQYCRFETIQMIMKQLVPAPNEYLQDYESTAEENVENGESIEISEIELDTEIYRSRLTNLIEGCFLEAVRQEASDIHFVPKSAKKVEIYFRIDGKLRLWYTQTGTKSEAVAAVLKDRSQNVNRFERDVAQDGFFQREIDGSIIRFRVSIVPLVGEEYERKFESIVVRILDDRKVIGDLKELGLLDRALVDFNKAISKPQGIVILTGPTGSGKSTTLMAALQVVTSPEVNVLTVEEPVEYLIKGARQLKINPKMDFDNAIRAILRHDPDIVMVGEIRDKITAEIAFKLANTGHLTFSTLHTNDAVSVVSRLYKIGIEPFLIAHAVNIVVAQRLVRKLCPECKKRVNAAEIPGAEALGFTADEIKSTEFYEPQGCDKCHNGFSGRLAVHEALFFTSEVREAILAMNDVIDENQIRSIALKNGMLTLRASGREKIKAGQTTCAEVAFATNEDE